MRERASTHNFFLLRACQAPCVRCVQPFLPNDSSPRQFVVCDVGHKQGIKRGTDQIKSELLHVRTWQEAINTCDGPDVAMSSNFGTPRLRAMSICPIGACGVELESHNCFIIREINQLYLCPWLHKFHVEKGECPPPRSSREYLWRY